MRKRAQDARCRLGRKKVIEKSWTTARSVLIFFVRFVVP
jgi:hypothetical protein